MGILRQNRDLPSTPLRIEDAVGITYADYVFDDDENDQDLVIIEAVISESSDDDYNDKHRDAYNDRCSRRKAKYTAKKAVKEAQRSINLGMADGINIKRNMGARKWRRIENARILSSFVDTSDVVYDCSDLVPEHLSAFAKILSDKEYMRAWNDFIEKDEAEQEAYLDELKDLKLSDDDSFDYCSSLEDSGDSKRKHHPAYSPKLAFQQLDNRFRKALSSRHVPLEMVENLEHTLRQVFANDHNSVWKDVCESSFRRFYIHAVAQYLSLKSKSGPPRGRTKETQVFNDSKQFSPPSERLSHVVRSIRNASRQFDSY